ncbi:MAG TPA: nucleotidyltransferase domain-containing protein [Candidatus Thermoplasmatota archaeon]|nr:nucleotidyltransferase domain-containing protein [Candidatus Thermoplasmatota archaeon]
MADLAALREDFAPIAGDVMAVILFGSHAAGTATARSDIDICLVGGPGSTPFETLGKAWSRARIGGKAYDLKAFEELPLYLKAEVIERGQILLAQDEPALSEYLRVWRRIWADQAHRNRPSRADLDRIAAVHEQRRRART